MSFVFVFEEEMVTHTVSLISCIMWWTLGLTMVYTILASFNQMLKTNYSATV